MAPRYAGWHRRVTALLVVLQTSVGSAVALAHAVEPDGGPVTLESHHTAQCVLLHDTARCAQCQFDATRMLSPATRGPVPPATTSRRLAQRVFTRPMPSQARYGTSHPRAPPLPLS